MDNPNAQQIEYWGGAGGQRWVASGDRIDRHMAAISELLFAFAAPRAGERVLDVGCGCGGTTLELWRKTGTRVVGLDVSPPMLEAAGQRPGAQDVEWRLADASTARFDAAFDLVFSRFGVMFFADPVAAFANLRAALAPGGRLAFVCWRTFEDNPWASAPFAAARSLLPPQSPVEPHAPGPFAFADGERLRGILARAGFRDIVIEPRASTMTMGDSVDDAADEALQIGPLARAAAELDDATRAQIRDRVRAAYAPFATAGHVSPPAAVWLVGAR